MRLGTGQYAQPDIQMSGRTPAQPEADGQLGRHSGHVHAGADSGAQTDAERTRVRVHVHTGVRADMRLGRDLRHEQRIDDHPGAGGVTIARTEVQVGLGARGQAIGADPAMRPR